MNWIKQDERYLKNNTGHGFFEIAASFTIVFITTASDPDVVNIICDGLPRINEFERLVVQASDV